MGSFLFLETFCTCSVIFFSFKIVLIFLYLWNRSTEICFEKGLALLLNDGVSTLWFSRRVHTTVNLLVVGDLTVDREYHWRLGLIVLK